MDFHLIDNKLLFSILLCAYTRVLCLLAKPIESTSSPARVGYTHLQYEHSFWNVLQDRRTASIVRLMDVTTSSNMSVILICSELLS